MSKVQRNMLVVLMGLAVAANYARGWLVERFTESRPLAPDAVHGYVYALQNRATYYVTYEEVTLVSALGYGALALFLIACVIRISQSLNSK